MHQQVASNVRASWLLVFLTCVLLGVVGYFIGGASGIPPEWGAVIAAVVAIVVALISYFGGSGAVLLASRAKKIEKRDHPRLFNVVEEMAIAAGVPMPEVYIINDSAPNAFATGRKPEQAKVAITTGLLAKLNRDELQGVMAHELSHVKNYDILFAMMMGVLAGTIVLLCDVFMRSMWYRGLGGRRRSSSGGRVEGVFMIVGLLLAIVAPLFAKLIQLSVSRKREYLADASAALLTRYPPGLASALQKISGDREVLEVANRATQHMYIVNPIKPFEERAKTLFSTHPDVADRIRRLNEMGHVSGAPEPSYTSSQRAGAPQKQTPHALGMGGLGRIFGQIDGGVTPLPGPIKTAGAASLVGSEQKRAEPNVSPPQTPRGACPRCREALRRAIGGGREIKGCRSCGGVWIGEGKLSELLRTSPRKLSAIDGKFLNFVGHGWNRVGEKRCPDCGGGPALREVRAGHASEVPLDLCPKCKGVWFDDGELPIVVAAAERAATATAT